MINPPPPAIIIIYDLLIKMNVCLLGVVMAACRLTVLYRFNVILIHDTHHDVNVEL